MDICFEIPSFASGKTRRKKAFCRERAPGSSGLVCFISLFVSFLPKESPHESGVGGGGGACFPAHPPGNELFPSQPQVQGSGLARDYPGVLSLCQGLGGGGGLWRHGDQCNSSAFLPAGLGITKLRGDSSLGIFLPCS